jgi:hypothetical protein
MACILQILECFWMSPTGKAEDDKIEMRRLKSLRLDFDPVAHTVCIALG